MKFYLEPPSLQCTTLTTIAALLWDRRDIRSEFPLIAAHGDYTKDALLAKIKTKVETFVLPKLIEKNLLHYVEIVGCEILNWFRIQCEDICVIPKKFFFTPHGSIDLVKTAVVLIEDETLNPINRFKLACIYCQEKYIRFIWPQLDKTMHHRLQTVPFFPDEEDVLIAFWSLYLEERLGDIYQILDRESLKHTNILGFYISFMSKNIVAARFFYEKLTLQEKEEHVIMTLTRIMEIKDTVYLSGRHIMIVRFLWNSMNDEQQNHLFQRFPTLILTLFLDWPWQEHFMEQYTNSHHMISKESFYDLLDQIIHNGRKDHRGFDYQKLFIKVWEQSSTTQRSHIYTSYNRMEYILCNLQNVEYWKAFKMILSCASADTRNKLLFCRKIMCTTTEWLIQKGNCDAIKEFVTECLVTKEEILEFRNRVSSLMLEYRNIGYSSCFTETRMMKVNELYTFIDSLLSFQDE